MSTPRDFALSVIRSATAPFWLRRQADIALHGWPKETGGAQTPAAARRLKDAWLKAGPK